MTKMMSRRQAGALALFGAVAGGGAAQAQMRAPMAHGAALTAGDLRYVADTMRVGGVALRSSQLARGRAAAPTVREFAEMEAREQTTIAQILAEVSGMRGPPPPDPRMAALEAELARARGPIFDRLYVQGQIEGHSQLLRIQEDYIRGGRNPHARHIAMLSRGQILDHLTLLRSGLLLRG
jgi:putative membrane protein